MQASPARGSDSMDVIDLGDGRSVRGLVDAGYGPVVDAFKANYVLRHDLGSACTAYVGGRRVVELWGGVADRRTRRAWNRDTAAVGGYGDARARELTLALGRVVGA